MKRKSAIFTLVVILVSSLIPIAAFAKKGGNGNGNGGGEPPPSGTPDPELVFSRPSGEGSALVVANADGSNQIILYATANSISDPDFSPTDNTIVFVEDNVALGIRKLMRIDYTVSADNVTASTPVELASNASLGGGVFNSPDVSPDGDWLVYRFKIGPEKNRLHIQSLTDDTVPVRRFYIGDGPELYIYTWNAVWLTQSPGHLAVSYNDSTSGNVDEIILLSLDPANPVLNPADPSEIWPMVVAGPQSIFNPEGVTSGVHYLETTRTRDGVIVNVETLSGNGKKKNQIVNVIHEWKPFFDPGSELEFSTLGPANNSVVGRRPVLSPDDQFVLTIRENRSGDQVDISPVSNPSDKSVLLSNAYEFDWKP